MNKYNLVVWAWENYSWQLTKGPPSGVQHVSHLGAMAYPKTAIFLNFFVSRSWGRLPCGEYHSLGLQNLVFAFFPLYFSKSISIKCWDLLLWHVLPQIPLLSQFCPAKKSPVPDTGIHHTVFKKPHLFNEKLPRTVYQHRFQLS